MDGRIQVDYYALFHGLFVCRQLSKQATLSERGQQRSSLSSSLYRSGGGGGNAGTLAHECRVTNSSFLNGR